MFGGHDSLSLAMNVFLPLSSPRVRAATLLVAANTVFWVWRWHVGYPLSLSDLADPVPAYTTGPHGGVTFNICHDCRPDLVLAGRAVNTPWGDDPAIVRLGFVANFPSTILVALQREDIEAALGYRVATWFETLAFALLSTAQWLAVGWVIGGAVERRMAAPIASERP